MNIIVDELKLVIGKGLFIDRSSFEQGHLNDGYGVNIKQYTKLLINKLEFHDRNPRIPANLTMKRGELEAIGGGDINFQ